MLRETGTFKEKQTSKMIKEVGQQCPDSARFVKEWRYMMKMLLSAKIVPGFVLIWRHG